MRLYKKRDFVRLPEGIIYSRVENPDASLMDGLFCKTSNGVYYENDFTQQDLISEIGYPIDITDGLDAFFYQTNLRDNFEVFRTDLDCTSRDAMYDEKDVFVVWDREDVVKLINYLSKSLNSEYYGTI